jgi:hypothetical protein
MLTERTHARREKQIIAHLLKLDNILVYDPPTTINRARLCPHNRRRRRRHRS